MKRALLISCLCLAALYSGHATEAAKLTDDEKLRIVEQMQAAAKDQEARLDSATLDLKTANARADTLQTKVNILATHDASETAKAKRLTKENSFLKTIIGIEAGIVAIFLCLWAKLPDLSPPWGLVATIAAGPLAFGVIKLL